MVDFEKLLSLYDTHIYWVDVNNVYQGCNNRQAISAGLSSRFEIVGKRNKDLPWNKNHPDIAALHDSINVDVMVNGRCRIIEEPAVLPSGAEIVLLSNKMPLYADDGVTVVGMLGVSLDITAHKMQEAKLRVERQEAFFTLDYILSHIPAMVYWKDKGGVYLGGNDQYARNLGLNTKDEFIGKTDFDLLCDTSEAERFRQHDLEIMEFGTTKITEQVIVSENVEAVILNQKIPLKNNNNEITGILGMSVDITNSKKAATLQFELELQRAKMIEQETFQKITEQVVHDIRSPLASLLMILKSCEEDLDEMVRVALREVATGIGDIANDLLYKYKNGYNTNNSAEEQRPIMVSLAIMQLLSEKRHQYKERAIKFVHNFSKGSNLAFINAHITNFKRMMSNIVDNAADALHARCGEICFKLEVDQQYVYVTVQDSGSGMQPEIVNKILNNVPVTANKTCGHGIGLIQANEVLHQHNGVLSINSQIGIGTEMILKFPRISVPVWLAEKITLNSGDVIIVLDDDQSVHSAWDNRLRCYKDHLQIKHFTLGQDVIDFVDHFVSCVTDIDKLVLLTDFELLKQDIDGLQVIDSTNIRRSLLVTSHYTSQAVQMSVSQRNIQIIPKPFASEIEIEMIIDDSCVVGNLTSNGYITGEKYDDGEYCTNNDKCCANNKQRNNKQNSIKNGGIESDVEYISCNKGVTHASENDVIDAVVIDDNELLLDSLMVLFEKRGIKAHKYCGPSDLLDNISQYSKSTVFFIDNVFQSESISGVELAGILHKHQFSSLYLFSGQSYDREKIPNYLQVILKTNIEQLLDAVGSITRNKGVGVLK